MIKSAMAEKLWSKLEKTLVNNGKAFISVTGGGRKSLPGDSEDYRSR